MEHQKEQDLFFGSENQFGIYQLKDTVQTQALQFRGFGHYKKEGLKVLKENYELVYKGVLEENMDLEDIFVKFNIAHPKDFKGHSLSVSDIVVLHQNGENTAHFVDSFGFTRVDEFLDFSIDIKNAFDNEVSSLAADLEKFVQNHDPYEYMDIVENPDDFIREITNYLVNHNVEHIKNYLERVINEEIECEEEVRKLIERIEQIVIDDTLTEINKSEPNISKVKKLQLDMDGTLANLTAAVLDEDGNFHIATLNEMMKEEDFFYRLPPYTNLIEAVKMFMEMHPEVEVSILSTALPDEPPAIPKQKNAWLDRYLPEVTKRYYVEPSTSKGEFLRDPENCEYYLLDDYNVNLEAFQRAGGTAIKMKNPYNGGGTGRYGGRQGHIWEGPSVSHDKNPVEIVRELEKIMNLPERDIPKDKENTPKTMNKNFSNNIESEIDV